MDYKSLYFPDLTANSYLAHAAVSPLNQRAARAISGLVQTYASQGLKTLGQTAALRNRVREKLARLIHTESRHIALTQNTSQGLWTIAHEFPWQRGDRLVLFRGEFPANILPWLGAAKTFGLEPIWLELDDLADENQAFREAMARRPRLMAISWVQFQTGRTFSPARLSQLRDIYQVAICLDAIQGLGALPLDLTKTPLDFVAGGGQKWLLATEGSGYLYVSPERMATLDPKFASWLSQEDPLAFLFEGEGLMDYHKPYRREATRFEWATMSSLPFAGLEASLDILCEVGAETITTRVTSLAAYCRTGMAALGLPVWTEQADAGIAAVKLPAGSLQSCANAMNEAGILVTTPDGYLRAAPHFYNERADIDLFLEVLAKQV